MVRVSTFNEIADEFHKRVNRIVWCTVATVDSKERPRSRILHPIWEGNTGWIATGRQSRKAADLAHNPYVSVSYWDQAHEQIYAECRAAWVDDLAEKRRLWEVLKTTPPPMGYDPALFWPAGPTDPGFGLLKLEPWRIELWSLGDMIGAKPAQVWCP